VLLLVVLTAISSKFIGCSIGAKMSGLSWRESAAVGILMNTRGLVELIVLNIGLEAKVITPKLFTVLVMMASGVSLYQSMY
jgi:Kef-type K+ transport system membrane component KefB